MFCWSPKKVWQRDYEDLLLKHEARSRQHLLPGRSVSILQSAVCGFCNLAHPPFAPPTGELRGPISPHISIASLQQLPAPPQLSFKRPQIPSNRDHMALNRATLGGLGPDPAICRPRWHRCGWASEPCQPVSGA